jgi:hypothetical protein
MRCVSYQLKFLELTYGSRFGIDGFPVRPLNVVSSAYGKVDQEGLTDKHAAAELVEAGTFEASMAYPTDHDAAEQCVTFFIRGEGVPRTEAERIFDAILLALACEAARGHPIAIGME